MLLIMEKYMRNNPFIFAGYKKHKLSNFIFDSLHYILALILSAFPQLGQSLWRDGNTWNDSANWGDE